MRTLVKKEASEKNVSLKGNIKEKYKNISKTTKLQPNLFLFRFLWLFELAISN